MSANMTGLIGIAERISEQECQHINDIVYDREYTPTLEMVKEAYALDGVRWGPLVEHDVNLVLSGYQHEYFLHWQQWEKLYRVNHSILYKSPESKFVYGKDTFRHISSFADEIKHEDYAYNMRVLSGWACPTEQTYFYKSNEWQRLAKAERFIGGYRCRRCKTNKSELHVHHEAPIKSAYSPEFSDNFVDWKLSLYCKDCHEWFHKNFTRQMMANDFTRATPEEIAEDRKKISEFWKRYHAEGKCQFCNNHQVTK